MRADEVKIAWVLSAYRKPGQVTHLIDRICGPQDSVWLHYDKKSPKAEFESICKQYRNDPRVHCFQKYRIYWGGIQSVLADVYSAQRLLASRTDFDYVIHLTGTTYPISTDAEFRQYLLENYGKSFIFLDPDEKIHVNGSERSKLFAREHFGITPGRNLPRYNLWHRFAFRVNLKWSRLLIKWGWRNECVALPKSFSNIYRGFVQNVIFKDHYLSALHSRNLKSFLAEIKYASCPDEVFFNTLLTNLVQPDCLVRTNNLLITYWGDKGGSPNDLSEEDIPNLLASGQYFARKFEDKNVLEKVDLALRGRRQAAACHDKIGAR